MCEVKITVHTSMSSIV